MRRGDIEITMGMFRAAMEKLDEEVVRAEQYIEELHRQYNEVEELMYDFEDNVEETD